MRRQTAMGKFLLVLLILIATPLFAGDMEDDPTLFAVFIDEFEWRDADEGGLLVWDAQGWIGKDLNKFWWKSDGGLDGGDVDDAEMQFLYSRAIATFWDVQIGLRTDIEPDHGHDWAVIGVQGLTPYFFELEAALFIGKSGQVEARLEAEYEFLFTQKLILSPELEINAYKKDDPDLRIGSSLSDVELSLRLRYEVRREFAPYIGVNWEKKFGKTADYARTDGFGTSETQLVVGIRAWF